MHVPEWKLGQSLLWLVLSELSCLAGVICPPVSWRRFWAIYGLRTSATKSLPLPLPRFQLPILSLLTDVPIPAVSHICPAVTLHLPSLGAPNPPRALCNQGSSGGALCPRSAPHYRDQPRDEPSEGKGNIGEDVYSPHQWSARNYSIDLAQRGAALVATIRREDK